MTDAEIQEKKLAIPADFTVLVTDDDESSRKTVVEYLHSFGFVSVIQAMNGYEAYHMIQHESVDLVISDWDMPVASGIELLKTMKREEAFKDIPFVMMTSPISQEQIKVEEAAALQIDAYLTKPFRATVLKAKLDAILEERKADLARGVLVVDDDAMVRSTMVEILEKMNYKPVFQAADGEAGLKLLQEKSDEIAMVVSDWEMPKLKGIDLLRRIRSDKKVCNIAFLMVTSQSSIENIKVDLAIKAEVDQYVIKPFTVEIFLSKVETVMRTVKVANKIKVRLEDAKRLLKDGDLFNSRRLYKHVQRLDPKNIDAYLGLAVVKLAERPGRGYDEAIYFVREAIKINPTLDYPYCELASVYERAGSLDKGVAALTEGAGQCPMSANIQYNLGRLLLKLGRKPQAISALEKAIQIQPDLEEAGRLLAVAKTN